MPRFPTRRRGRLTGAVLATALLVAGFGIVASSLGGPPPPDRYVAPGGADTGACASASEPCRSLGYAYRAAAPGEVVEVAGGRYPAQAIPRVRAREGPPVTFRPADDARVVLDALDVAGDRIEVRDMATGPLSVDAGPRTRREVADVAVVNGGGPTIWVRGARRLRIAGGTYGGTRNEAPVKIAGSPASREVTFDGVTFRDAVVTDPAAHSECIWAAGVQGLTIRDSTFRNCAYFDVYLTRFESGDPRDVLIERNDLGPTRTVEGTEAPYAVNVSSWIERIDGLVVRDNVLGGEIAIQPEQVGRVEISGNRGPNRSCRDGVDYHGNVWHGVTCDPTDRLAAEAAG